MESSVAHEQPRRRNRPPIIEMRDVSKVYPGGHLAVDRVSLAINRGEFVFLVGPTGCGKSTFIQLLMKELDADRRPPLDRRARHHAARAASASRYLRRNIGTVFQDFKLLPNRTVYDNVAYSLLVTGASRAEIRQKVPHSLRLVGLSTKLHNYPDQLSGGEQQRVSIARAFVNHPPLLICDEPTGNLDPETSLGIMQLIYRINRTGTTVVVVTHDSEMVDRMRRRVIELYEGRVVRDEARRLHRRVDDRVRHAHARRDGRRHRRRRSRRLTMSRSLLHQRGIPRPAPQRRADHRRDRHDRDHDPAPRRAHPGLPTTQAQDRGRPRPARRSRSSSTTTPSRAEVTELQKRSRGIPTSSRSTSSPRRRRSRCSRAISRRRTPHGSSAEPAAGLLQRQVATTPPTSRPSRPRSRPADNSGKPQPISARSRRSSTAEDRADRRGHRCAEDPARVITVAARASPRCCWSATRSGSRSTPAAVRSR